MATLTYIRPDGGEQNFDVRNQSVVIGRLADSPVPILDSFISRVHCDIRFSNDKFYLKDLGSANGTYCNGARIYENTLAHGDQIQIGNTTLVVEINESRAILRQLSPVTIAAAHKGTGPIDLPARITILLACLLATATFAQTTNTIPPFTRGILVHADAKTGELVLKTAGTNYAYHLTPRTHIFRGDEKLTPDKLTPGDYLKLRVATDSNGVPTIVRIKVDTNTTPATPLTIP
jgi:pSer/pThr/pTyr-binding forkhead associated (FHA) protein